MKGKITVIIGVALMLAQYHETEGATLYLFMPSRDLASDQQQAQYGVVRLSAEAALLRLHAFLPALELEHNVRKINLQIFDKMTTLGVPADKIAELKDEMSTRGEKISKVFLDTYTAAETLATLVADTNNHIVNDQSLLSSDLAAINSQVNSLDVTYDLGKDNVILNLDLLELKVENQINQFSGPEVEEIRTLMTEARAMLQKEADTAEVNKISLDQASTVTVEALQVLIDSLANN